MTPVLKEEGVYLWYYKRNGAVQFFSGIGCLTVTPQKSIRQTRVSFSVGNRLMRHANCQQSTLTLPSVTLILRIFFTNQSFKCT